MATKKDNTKKKVTKKDTAKKSTNKKAKKIEKVVEEVNLVDETEEKVLNTFNSIKEDDTIYVVGGKKTESNTKLEVMNGDPSVITPIDESAPIEEPTPVEEQAPVEEPEPKEKIMKKISRAFGYFWNGQMIDF
jgi:(p)ppGpp synthase/HD superfamily hydrolase